MSLNNQNIHSDFNEIAFLGAGEVNPLQLPMPPYPYKYEKDVVLHDGTIAHLRPICEADETAIKRFFASLSEESVFFRFGQLSINLTHDHLYRLCQFDCARDLTFLAEVRADAKIIIGEAQLNIFNEHDGAELSFVVADHWQGKGIGSRLMDFCLMVAKDIGLKKLLMVIMKNNVRMRHLGYKFAFHRLQSNEEEDTEELLLNIG